MIDTKINPKSPFNFELSAKIFSNGDPQIQRYEKGLLAVNMVK